MENNIPDSIKALANSADIFDVCEEVGKKFDLHIDQIGELDAQVREVLRGAANSKDFTKDIQKGLGTDGDLASKITAEINVRVFQTMKEKLQAESSAHEISDFERAGGFNMEPSLASEAADGKITGKSDVTEHDKDNILSDIEDPKPAPSTVEASRTEPLVDHLLGNASGQTEQKIEHKTEIPPANLPIDEEAAVPKQMFPPAPKPAPQPSGPKGPDPYREAVN